jgi:hypothetical protein
MSTFVKLPLSASSYGQQVLITATTSGSANPIHTTLSGTGSLDEVWIYAYNDSTSSILTSILWGSTIESASVNRFSILPRSGRTLMVDGKIAQNSLSISAYAAVSNVILFDGFVNRATFS